METSNWLLVDFHAHCLPALDDGAADVKTSVTLLEMMKRQGITHVIATPHFNPMRDSIERFNANVKSSVAELAHEVRDGDYPTIHLGCELYYFKGMGKSDSLGNFRLANVPYLLLELPYNTPINDSMIRDIEAIYDNSGLMPILAHIERYSSVQGFKKALGLIENGGALAHINAGAVLSKEKIKEAFARFGRRTWKGFGRAFGLRKSCLNEPRFGRRKSSSAAEHA